MLLVSVWIKHHSLWKCLRYFAPFCMMIMWKENNLLRHRVNACEMLCFRILFKKSTFERGECGDVVCSLRKQVGMIAVYLLGFFIFIFNNGVSWIFAFFPVCLLNCKFHCFRLYAAHPPVFCTLNKMSKFYFSFANCGSCAGFVSFHLFVWSVAKQNKLARKDAEVLILTPKETILHKNKLKRWEWIFS